MDTQISRIIYRVPPPVATFLVSSAHTAEEVIEQIRATSASVVQLVDPSMEATEIERLRSELAGLRLVKVIHVEDETALDCMDQYSPHVHAFLLDSGNPNLQVPEYGGTGRVHDWSVSAEFVMRSPHPVFLAGGLTARNVAEAISIVKPFGVDLCGGVRTGGRLDRGKLFAFVDAVRIADETVYG